MSKIKDMAEIYAAEKMHFLAVVGDSDDDSQEQLLQDAYEDGANAVLKEIEEAANICFDEEVMKAIRELKGG